MFPPIAEQCVVKHKAHLQRYFSITPEEVRHYYGANHASTIAKALVPRLSSIVSLYRLHSLFGRPSDARQLQS